MLFDRVALQGFTVAANGREGRSTFSKPVETNTISSQLPAQHSKQSQPSQIVLWPIFIHTY